MKRVALRALASAIAVLVGAAPLLFPSPAAAQFSIFGTSADLNLKIDPLVRGGKAAVVVDVLVRRAVSADRVYVELRCSEVINIDDYTVAAERDQGKVKTPERKIKVSRQDVVELKDYTIATNQQYVANTTQQLKGEIEVPAGFPISAKGRMFQVKCEARSGLSIFGNDPNSSWQDVEIK